MIIYPTQASQGLGLSIRDTAKAFEIDDNDPEFQRDPTGLYAVYYGEEPVRLLQATETPGEWDVILKVRRVHFEKLTLLLRNVLLHL
jgi:hypothetical protein